MSKREFPRKLIEDCANALECAEPLYSTEAMTLAVLRACGYAILKAERDAMQASADHYQILLESEVETIKYLKAERDEARAEVKRLHELDPFVPWTDEQGRVWGALTGKGHADLNADLMEARTAALKEAKDKIDYRLNDYLVEMKEGWDDSITGFNEAWDIVTKAFAALCTAPPAAKDTEPKP